MGRKGWIIAGVAAILIVGSLVALTVLTGQWGYKTMTGPVAIIQGPVPRHGILGVEYAATGSGAATIKNVMPGSGAAEAGLRAGDVIVAVDGTDVRDSATVKRIIEKTKPGDVLALRIRRGDEERDVSVGLISFEQFVELDIVRRGAAPTTMKTAPATAPSVTP
jgi:S1-C subfamily serine protease